MGKTGWIVALFLSAALTGAAGADELNDYAKKASCLVSANNIFKLSVAVQGTLSKVAVNRADIVKKGQIVAELESGKAPLERSVDVYRRGALLKAHCEAKLRAAQLQVEKIILGPGGPVGVEPAEFA